ncbi:Multidrug resistance protein 1 [Gonapodya sp. JEL0774]|nr:Multidrug resistance protein 1 [Gonapodya sp. JEL0774]
MDKTDIDKKLLGSSESDLDVAMPRKDRQSDKLRKKGKPEDPKVSFVHLFRFATRLDLFLLLLGICASGVRGAMQPMISLLLNGIVSAIIGIAPGQIATTEATEAGKRALLDNFRNQINSTVVWYCIFGAISGIAGYIQSAALTVSAERQLKTIREQYFKAILRQDVGWFDQNMTGDLTSRLQSDTGLVKAGMAEKLGNVFQAIAQFFTGIIIAYVKGWKMALVFTAIIPINLACVRAMGSFLTPAVANQQNWLGQASILAQQVFTGVRTVHSFSGFNKSRHKYDKLLEEAAKFGTRVGFTTGIGMGSIMFSMFVMHGIVNYYAAILVYNGAFTGGEAINVFFAMQTALFAITTVGSDISQIAIAQGAAYKIWQVVDRVSPIDSWTEDGERPSNVEGEIVFSRVRFSYKSRPDQITLQNFSLTIPKGTKVALVGESGSGKSTIVKLATRFYDPVDGVITLDGRDLKSLNVKWLRQQIGIVAQEPALFDGTIRANILMGIADPSKYSSSELEEKVLQSIKMAHADFVMTLPAGLDTVVGQRGGMLSGGQKQRIAIARAIIGEPKVLLFDEATSALDTASEKIVQKAIDMASTNRTSITVAHRLSTIMNADLIVVMRHGEIVETGTHNELLSRNGPYARLVETQELKETEQGGLQNDDDGWEGDHSIGKTSPPSASRKRLSSANAAKESGSVSYPVGSGVKKISKADIAKALEAAELEQQGLAKIEREKHAALPIPWRRIAAIASPSWRWMLLGSIGSLVAGGAQPIMSLLISGMLTAFSKIGQEILDDARLYAILYVVFAVIQLTAFTAHIGAWAAAGEQFTLRLRSMFFHALVKQEVAFFDDPRNNVGALTAKLADDATQVKGLFNDVLTSSLQILGALIAGLTMSFVYGWKLTLVMVAVLPIFVASFAAQSRTTTFFSTSSRVETLETNNIANEAISQIRTVAMLTKEEMFWKRYCQDLVAPYEKELKGAILSSFAAGVSASIQFLFMGFAWWYGGTLVYGGEYTGSQLQQVFFGILFTAMSLGRAAAFAPSMSKAQVSAGAVFEIIDRIAAIDATSNEGATPPTTGSVEATEIHFTYPFRNSYPVLRGVSIRAKQGQTVALVGPSGSGKSTITALLERFYDVTSGDLRVDGTKVQDWNLPALRMRQALVGQEPVLFDGTVAENIAYGLPDGVTVTQELIQAAAVQANAYTFVSELKDGFNTAVGESGGLLRIAIARALIRNPTFLLLDEATSALDSESGTLFQGLFVIAKVIHKRPHDVVSTESIVQAALIDASKGRTTIVIAHRLSSIQNADCIYVINAGLVEEFGTHSELMGKKGLYWELAQQQSLGAASAGN